MSDLLTKDPFLSRALHADLMLNQPEFGVCEMYYIGAIYVSLE